MIFLTKKQIFTIPNFLSALRMFLGLFLFFYYLVFLNYETVKHIFIISIIIAYISDILDGYIARKTNNITEFGKIIDPLADKIFIFVLVLVLYLSGLLSKFLFYSIIIRDIFILLGSLVFIKKKNFVIPSNYIGKFTVFFIGGFLLSLFLGVPYSDMVKSLLEFSLVLILIVSLIKYLFDEIKLLKEG